MVILDGDRRSDGRYLEISESSCAEGATLDWRWPLTYGSGPFALATPCTHVPGRYSGPSKFKSHVAHPWSWDIGSSTSAAQTSLNMVLSRRKARPFVRRTNLGLQRYGQPSLKGTALWPGPCSMGWGTTGSASSQRSERCEANWAFRIRPARDQARRVNVQSGCSRGSEPQSACVAGMSSPPLSKPSHRAEPFERPVPWRAGSLRPQALIQNPQAAPVRGFVLTAWSSCAGPRRSAARNRRLSRSSRPVLPISNAFSARPRPAWSHHILSPTLLRAPYCVPSRV